MASKKQSAGLLMYKNDTLGLRVLLAHPGGPLFKNKYVGYWSIPKGEFEPEETILETAIREFEEETGYAPDPALEYIPLGTIKQKGGKIVHAWAFEGEWEEGRKPDSNTFEFQWPFHSGKYITIPEIDDARMMTVSEAREVMKEEQKPFVERLLGVLTTKQIT